MQITWWGAAGFAFHTGPHRFLIDPYLSRNPKARPVQALGPQDVERADQIFVSHGHFDHLGDVPAIAAKTGAMVYCSRQAAATLEMGGLRKEQIRPVATDGERFDFGPYAATAHFSRHVRFDRTLLARTLARIHFRMGRVIALMRRYPCGQVISWRFTAEGRTLHHFGSGGSTPEELDRFAQTGTDLLLVPLQGHTRICDIALSYVDRLRPAMTIPHHQDDFFPPVSSRVDIGPFLEGMKRRFGRSGIRVLDLNETIDY